MAKKAKVSLDSLTVGELLCLCDLDLYEGVEEYALFGKDYAGFVQALAENEELEVALEYLNTWDAESHVLPKALYAAIKPLLRSGVSHSEIADELYGFRDLIDPKFFADPAVVKPFMKAWKDRIRKNHPGRVK